MAIKETVKMATESYIRLTEKEQAYVMGAMQALIAKRMQDEQHRREPPSEPATA